MDTKKLFMTSLAIVLFCGCSSRVEKVANELQDLTEQYIKDLDNAQTKEEASGIIKNYKDRTKFEIKKLSEEEIKEYENNCSWEKYQELKELEKEKYNAINRAKERFRNK